MLRQIVAFFWVVAAIAWVVEGLGAEIIADESFGSSGRVVVDFGHSDADRGNAVVRVPGEDRVYIIGQVTTDIAGDDDFGVVCLLDDGSPCPDFGVSGRATVPMDFSPYGLDAAIDGAVVPWGPSPGWRLVVVGQVERALPGDIDFGVAMLRPDGSLEKSASGGKVALGFDHPGDYRDVPAAVAVDGQGRIVIGGTVFVQPDDRDWGFWRLNTDLTVDSSFGDNGRSELDVAGLSAMRSMILQPDGKIVAVGSRDFGDDQMVIARLNADGSPDTSFGFLGQTVFDGDLVDSTDDCAWDVAMDRQNRFVLVGEKKYVSTGKTCWFAARVLSTGQPDSTYSTEGATASWCYGGALWAGRAVAVFNDRAIIVAESTQNGNHDFLVIEELPSGTDKFTFSAYLFPFDLGGDNDDRPRGVLIQPDGKIVVSGRAVGPDDTLDFGVLRLRSHQIFSDGFEAWGSAAEWGLVVGSP